MLQNRSPSSSGSKADHLLRQFFLLACFFVGTVQSQQQQSSSCADRSDFAVISSVADAAVSEVSLGLQECVYADGTPIDQAFQMTRFVWTVEPTDGDATVISTNAGNLVSAVTTPIIVDEDDDDAVKLSQNGTVRLEFLPGPDLLTAAAPDGQGEVGLVLQIPRDHLVELEYNFRDSSVVLQLHDGFTRLRKLAVFASSTQSAAHVRPGEGPTLKGVVNSSQHPLQLSLRGNAMDVQLESATMGFGSVYIESRNSHIQLKGDVLENADGNNRILGGNKDMCTDDSDDCGKGLKVVIEGSIDGNIELTNVNGFESGAPTPEGPLVKVHVNDPTGNFDCADGTLFVAFTAGANEWGPGIQCATTTDTVTTAPPFNCTTDPTASYQNVLTCPANGEGEKPEDETCECTVVVPPSLSSSPNGDGGDDTNARPATPSSDSGVRERIYRTDRLVLLLVVYIGLASLWLS